MKIISITGSTKSSESINGARFTEPNYRSKISEMIKFRFGVRGE
jgi:hypothetical protein